MPRRFPSPWSAELIPGGFVVKDATGQSLAYVYARESKAQADTAKVLTMDEARRVGCRTLETRKLWPNSPWLAREAGKGPRAGERGAQFAR